MGSGGGRGERNERFTAHTTSSKHTAAMSWLVVLVALAAVVLVVMVGVGAGCVARMARAASPPPALQRKSCTPPQPQFVLLLLSARAAGVYRRAESEKTFLTHDGRVIPVPEPTEAASIDLSLVVPAYKETERCQCEGAVLLLHTWRRRGLELGLPALGPPIRLPHPCPLPHSAHYAGRDARVSLRSQGWLLGPVTWRVPRSLSRAPPPLTRSLLCSQSHRLLPHCHPRCSTRIRRSPTRSSLSTMAAPTTRPRHGGLGVWRVYFHDD